MIAVRMTATDSRTTVFRHWNPSLEKANSAPWACYTSFIPCHLHAGMCCQLSRKKLSHATKHRSCVIQFDPTLLNGPLYCMKHAWFAKYASKCFNNLLTIVKSVHKPWGTWYLYLNSCFTRLTPTASQIPNNKADMASTAIRRHL